MDADPKSPSSPLLLFHSSAGRDPKFPDSGSYKSPHLPHDIVFLVLEQLALISSSNCSSVSRVASWAYRLAMSHLLRHVIIHSPGEAQRFYPTNIHIPNTHYPPSVIERLAFVHTLAVDPRTRTAMLFEPRILHFLPGLRRVLVPYMLLLVMAKPSEMIPRPGLDMTISGSNLQVRKAFSSMPSSVSGKPTMLSTVTHLHLLTSSLRDMPDLAMHLPLLTHLAAEYTERIGLDVQFPTDHLTMLVFLAPVDMPFALVWRIRTKVAKARQTGREHIYYGEWSESLYPLRHWDFSVRCDEECETVWERAMHLTGLIDLAEERAMVAR